MKNETFCTVLLSTNSLVPSYYLTLNLETIGYIEIAEIMTEYHCNVTCTVFVDCPDNSIIMPSKNVFFWKVIHLDYWIYQSYFYYSDWFMEIIT